MLNSMNCPFILTTNDFNTINLYDLRELLMIAGWLMSVSDIFGKFQQICIDKIIEKLDHFDTKKIKFNQVIDQQILNNNDNVVENLIEIYKKIIQKFKNLLSLD